MSEIKYSPLCFLCRIEAGRDPAGVPKDDLCYSHMNREWHKEKTAKAEMLEALKGAIELACNHCKDFYPTCCIQDGYVCSKNKKFKDIIARNESTGQKEEK